MELVSSGLYPRQGYAIDPHIMTIKHWLLAMTSLALLMGCNPSSDTASQSATTNDQAKTPTSHTHAPEAAPHSHDGESDHHDQVPGPNGGRLVVGVEPHLEFFVTADHHAQITFVNDDIQPIPPADLSLSLTAGDRSNPTLIEFTEKDGVLLSNTPLPKEHNAPLVLQITGGENNEPVFERFHLNMETCSGCQLSEYACICGHTH